jgi:flagellar protein FlgJ
MLNDKLLNPALAAQRAEVDGAEAPVAPAAAPDAARDPVYVKKATKAAVDFESFFISHMLHQMRSSARELAPEDSVFKDPVNRDMQDMADDLLAGQMAGKRAFGIADAILRQLLPAPLNNSK